MRSLRTMDSANSPTAARSGRDRLARIEFRTNDRLLDPANIVLSPDPADSPLFLQRTTLDIVVHRWISSRVLAPLTKRNPSIDSRKTSPFSRPPPAAPASRPPPPTAASLSSRPHSP